VVAPAEVELGPEVELSPEVELAPEVELPGSFEVEAGEVELAALPDTDVICGAIDEAKPSPGPPPHAAAQRQAARNGRRIAG
jgi:hypothetical protein